MVGEATATAGSVVAAGALGAAVARAAAGATAAECSVVAMSAAVDTLLWRKGHVGGEPSEVYLRMYCCDTEKKN